MSTVTPSRDLVILRHFAARTSAGAAEIGVTGRLAATEVRARLVGLDGRLVDGRRDEADRERAAGIIGARRPMRSPSRVPADGGRP